MRLRLIPAALSAALSLLSVSGAWALMPFPKPEPAKGVANGSAAPFVGNWAVVWPSMVMGKRDADLAICTLPVRIEALGDETILYLQPRQKQSDTVMALQKTDGGTLWKPEAPGQQYFAFWVSADGFYLYDRVPQVEADWGRPYVYRRCP